MRILNPEEYPVDLSRDLWEEKQNLLKKIYASIRKKTGDKGFNPSDRQRRCGRAARSEIVVAPSLAP